MMERMSGGRRVGPGFTYIEVTITFTIIAILAAIAVPNFLEAQTRSAVSRSKMDMCLLKSAINTYRFETRTWPVNAQAGKEEPYALTVLTTPIPYLVTLPFDSFLKDDVRNIKYQPTTPQMPYRYLNGLQVTTAGLKLIDTVGQASMSNIYPPYSPSYPPGALPLLPAGGPAPEQPEVPMKRGPEIGTFGYVVGLIHGTGPDGQEHPLGVGPDGVIDLVIYDPSNGTSSPGVLLQAFP